jgi:hypothetical protein
MATRVRSYVPLALLIGALVGALVAPSTAQAVQYRLEVANISDDAFFRFVQGPIGNGEGELAMPELARRLDDGTVDRGALLYDRDILVAGPTVARAWGAVPVQPTGPFPVQEPGDWKTVTWEGVPGQRTVWIVMPETMNHNWAKSLALAGTGTRPDLRYFLPYNVSLRPAKLEAVTYHLEYLRMSENGVPLWDRTLGRTVSEQDGIAAVVGSYPRGDWVYLVIEQPPTPTTFKAVVGWRQRGANDGVEHGGGCCGGMGGGKK